MTLNFTITELCKSDTAARNLINNTPSMREADNLMNLIVNILQPLRNAYGKPIRVNSGYRCSKLNSHPEVRGKANSQHLYGQAADIVGYDGSITETRKLFGLIQDLRLPFDQLILEHNAFGAYWVHVSYKADGNNRNEVIGNLLKQ